MERKKHLVFIIIMMLGLTIGKVKANRGEDKELTATITNIKWWDRTSLYSMQNLTVFWIEAEFQMYNPNNFDVNLTLSHCEPRFQLNLIWDLDDNSIDIDHYYGYESCCDWSSIFTYKPGITINKTSTEIGISGLNRTTLPDGTYTFWVYLDYYLEPQFYSQHTMLKIENGIPTFPYYPTVKLSIGKGVFFLAYIIFTICFHFYKKHKKNVETQPPLLHIVMKSDSST